MYETFGNWGRCVNAQCKTTWGKRCTTDCCAECCELSHAYWLGHKMAGTNDYNQVSSDAINKAKAAGEDPPGFVKAQETRAATTVTTYNPLPAHYAEPKPKVPEVGKITELKEENVIVPLTDNSYAGDKGGKSGFPITYFK